LRAQGRSWAQIVAKTGASKLQNLASVCPCSILKAIYFSIVVGTVVQHSEVKKAG
jgi:hypothetical protein